MKAEEIPGVMALQAVVSKAECYEEAKICANPWDLVPGLRVQGGKSQRLRLVTVEPISLKPTALKHYGVRRRKQLERSLLYDV